MSSKVKVIVAVLFFAIAAALLAYQFGLFGGGSKPKSSSIPPPQEGAPAQQEGLTGSSKPVG